MKLSPEHENRINRAVNFINENPSEDLSLERLAGLVNYSPFHFQRLFRIAVGETPKQYILRIRLETAAHAMVMFQHRSITEIALNNGFSSSATFSRAFRKYFGVSPQELKRIPHKERYAMYRQGKLGRHILDTDQYFSKANDTEDVGAVPLVRVVRSDAIRGIFVSTSLDDEKGIRDAFKKVAKLSTVHDLENEQTRFLGVLYPHQRVYQAVATIDMKQSVPNRLDVKEIEAGKFGVLTITGGVDKTFAALKDFTAKWLPDSGYRIADISGFETFSTNPTLSDYADTTREAHIRIEPAV